MTFNLLNLNRASELSKRGIRSQYIDNMLDNFFNEFYPLSDLFTSQKTSGDLLPRINISETDSAYNLEAELPGINLEDIDIKIDHGVLTIKGEKKDKFENKEKNYYVRERYYGSFQRSISLPNNINPDKVDARFENGVLHIEIPKKDQETAKKIEIKR